SEPHDQEHAVVQRVFGGRVVQRENRDDRPGRRVLVLNGQRGFGGRGQRVVRIGLKQDRLPVPIAQFPARNRNRVGGGVGVPQRLNGQGQGQHDGLCPLPLRVGFWRDADVGRGGAHRQIHITEFHKVGDRSIQHLENVCLRYFVRPIQVIGACLGRAAKME